MVRPRVATQPVHRRPIAQPVMGQANKVVPTPSASANKVNVLKYVKN